MRAEVEASVFYYAQKYDKLKERKVAERMGRFVNSRTSAFQDVLNSEIYVDKTGLLEYTNRVIDTTAKFICNSRPRRFGKSITADMITAYYSKACNSESMFSNLQIGRSIDFKKHYDKKTKTRECVIEKYQK